MKRVLIISPYFPPVNAADMQRIRVSLPYLKDLGWDATVVTVDPEYADMVRDELLNDSIPADIRIVKVKALNKSLTSKLGLGSIALRSLYYYRKKVNKLLKNEKFDLLYFSTTQFPVCILGPYWKKRFKVPYVIDMQDPWHSNYYQDKPKDQRPSKYWFSYRLNKYLEPVAMKNVDGLISVSENYVTDLKNRYPEIKNIPSATITFGAFEPDMQIAHENKNAFNNLLDDHSTNIVYIGRGGADMHKAITPLFKALKKWAEIDIKPIKPLKIYFIGTSYAPNGTGTPGILPLAKQHGVQDQVMEITDRISYYHTLITLQQADALFIPGSDDPKYTASKIYPYLLTKKPLLAIFNPASSAVGILKEYGAKAVYDYKQVTDDDIVAFFADLRNTNRVEQYNTDAVKKYSAKQMALNQCLLFNKVVK